MKWPKNGIATIMTTRIIAAPTIQALSCTGQCVQSLKVFALHARPKCMWGGQITPFHRRGCEGDQFNQGRRAF